VSASASASSPSPPSSASPRRPAAGGTGAALVIDPRAGSVSLDGVGTPAAPNVTLVKAPSAGDVVCGQAGVCQPTKVRLPIP
jgi:hypothetical protein